MSEHQFIWLTAISIAVIVVVFGGLGYVAIELIRMWLS